MRKDGVLVLNVELGDVHAQVFVTRVKLEARADLGRTSFHLLDFKQMVLCALGGLDGVRDQARDGHNSGGCEGQGVRVLCVHKV